MFKKLIIAAISASFLVSAAFADSTSVGFRITSGDLSASGQETTNLGISSVTAQTERSASFEMGSIFIEHHVDASDAFGVTVGLDYVPMTADIATLAGTTGFNAKISAGNLFTAYVQPTINLNSTVSVFGKAGISAGDLELTDFSRQAITDAANGIASADIAQDKGLTGFVFGIGAQVNRSLGPIDFIRLEATETKFDRITHTNTNGKVLHADASMELISLSIGKSF
tara:strand:- start:4 stop:684 length:681 start_codon:yes stop_codon:yes gene_type:complete